jgi:hypothetical protein
MGVPTRDTLVENVARGCYELQLIQYELKGIFLPHWDNNDPNLDASARALLEASKTDMLGFTYASLAGWDPIRQHESWLFDQAVLGWTYGDSYDPVNKKDPRMVHWDEYPQEKQMEIMQAFKVIRTLCALIGLI